METLLGKFLEDFTYLKDPLPVNGATEAAKNKLPLGGKSDDIQPQYINHYNIR